jgi:hypothetical protein
MNNKPGSTKKIELDDPSKALVKDLVVDVFESMKALHADNQSQYARRTFVRTLFSFLEGFGRVLRASILGDEQASFLPLEWRFVLRDERIEIEQTGTPKLKDARFQFTNLFAATLRSWAMLRGWNDERIALEIFGDNGWQRFQNALKVRHALTHPKLGQVIDVNDEGLAAAFDSFKWLSKICLQLLDVPLGEIDKLMNWKPGS